MQEIGALEARRGITLGGLKIKALAKKRGL